MDSKDTTAADDTSNLESNPLDERAPDDLLSQEGEKAIRVKKILEHADFDFLATPLGQGQTDVEEIKRREALKGRQLLYFLFIYLFIVLFIVLFSSFNHSLCYNLLARRDHLPAREEG